MSNTFSCHHPLYSKQTLHINKHGFTIVELLIVIVVIAILAAISIVSYNGIQQRANNTAIINAASQSVKMIKAYIAANDKYPYSQSSGTGWGCITVETTCHWNSSTVVPNSGLFNSNIKSIGNPPTSAPNGIFFFWNGVWTYKDESRPFSIMYYIDGVNQQCNLSDIVTINGTVLQPSTTGYTDGNAMSGKTRCMVTIPGPSA